MSLEMWVHVHSELEELLENSCEAMYCDIFLSLQPLLIFFSPNKHLFGRIIANKGNKTNFLDSSQINQMLSNVKQELGTMNTAETRHPQKGLVTCPTLA